MASTFVIFGASGDLTSRKLIPSLYELFRKKKLPEKTCIVGFSRTEFSHDAWRDALAETTAKFASETFDRDIWQEFAKLIYYHPGDISNAEDFRNLSTFLEEIESGKQAARVYYLSTAPRFYEQAVQALGASGLAREQGAPRRLVVEKPFGTDLETAKRLNEVLHQVFEERQVYRIDHYLGKETVQNLLVLRFANAIFEPIWNRTYIDHVQITVAEEVKVGRRGDYYDTSGILRDMFQNHLLQLVMITAMEAPLRFEADAVRNEKVKVLDAIRPLSREQIAHQTLRGQYEGYRDEPGVDANSQTSTFAVVRLCVDNWRWQGVPFYLRSGKAMSCRTTQIVIQFREPPHMMFRQPTCGTPGANRLVIQVQPAEGIQLHFQTKVPDEGMQLRWTDLDFSYHREFSGTVPQAYERLLHDTLSGDASLFARADEVELSWGIIDPILRTWREIDVPKLLVYPPGEWGPSESTTWMHQQQREWFDACPVLH